MYRFPKGNKRLLAGHLRSKQARRSEIYPQGPRTVIDQLLIRGKDSRKHLRIYLYHQPDSHRIKHAGTQSQHKSPFNPVQPGSSVIVTDNRLHSLGQSLQRHHNRLHQTRHNSHGAYRNVVIDALVLLRSNRATYLVDEARKPCRGALIKVLNKVAYWNPNPDFNAALESLPEGVDLVALEERIKPVISRVDGVRRIEGQRRD